MSRPTIKTDLIIEARSSYEKMNNLISKLTEKELSTPFDFSNNNKKKEAHWNRDKNIRDILIHIYEWHNLLLDWIRGNKDGNNKPFIPAPYNWRTYGNMNIEFWKKHQNTSLDEAIQMLEKSHNEILNLVESFSNKELFSKGVYVWVGGSTLGSYFVSSTSSHYNWAIKKIKAHIKNCESI